MEVVFLVSAGLTKEVAYLLLDGRRNKSLAIAVLIEVGLAVAGNKMAAHVRFYATGHIGIEDMHHPLRKLHLLRLAE